MARLLDDASTQTLNGTAPVTSMPLTIACRFNCDDASNVGTLMALDDDGGSVQFYRMVVIGVASPKSILGNMSYGGFPDEQSTSVTGWTENTWNAVACRFASTTERVICLNGTLATDTNSGSAPSGISKVRFGAYRHPTNGISQKFSGSLADCAVWNAALTDAQLTAYTSGYSAKLIRPDALVAHWDFFDNDGDVDSWGQYNLTPVNSPTYSAHAPIIYRKQPRIVIPAPAAPVAKFSIFDSPVIQAA